WSDALSRVLRQPPAAPRQLNRNVPRDLEAVCLKCLEKDPRRRYRTARELAEDLRRFLDQAPVKARRQSPLRLAGYWTRTKRWKVLLAAAVLIAAGSYTWVRSYAQERDLQLANEQRKGAEQLAEVERLAAHAARVTAARQSARRGDWDAALSEYDHAI